MAKIRNLNHFDILKKKKEFFISTQILNMHTLVPIISVFLLLSVFFLPFFF